MAPEDEVRSGFQHERLQEGRKKRQYTAGSGNHLGRRRLDAQRFAFAHPCNGGFVMIKQLAAIAIAASTCLAMTSAHVQKQPSVPPPRVNDCQATEQPVLAGVSGLLRRRTGQTPGLQTAIYTMRNG